MYKWPQGRVIRTICLILALVVTADLGYSGAYGRIAVWSAGGDGAGRQLALGIVFAALAAAALIAGIVAAGFKARSVDFLIDVEREMVRVEWPKFDSLVKSTLIIAATITVLAFVLFGVDLALLSFMNYLLTHGKNLL